MNILTFLWQMFNVVLVIVSIVLIIRLLIRKKKSGEGLNAKGKVVLCSCVLIICAVLICAGISVARPFGSFVSKADRIEIRNGNTGQLYVLENEKARALADELKDTAEVFGIGINYPFFPAAGLVYLHPHGKRR